MRPPAQYWMSIEACKMGIHTGARQTRAGSDRGDGAVAVWMLFWRTRVMLAMLAVGRGRP
jgi:hypothetical protein